MLWEKYMPRKNTGIITNTIKNPMENIDWQGYDDSMRDPGFSFS